MNNYPQVVKDIHNEFNIAGERLLQESLSIIANAEQVDLDKAKRLNEVGFSSNPQLTKALEIEEITRSPALMAKIVLKYKQEFPLNKFISNSDIDKICAKYKLVRGNTEQYIGFVPNKNLTEIENFKNNNEIHNRSYITNVVFSYGHQKELHDVFKSKLAGIGSTILQQLDRRTNDLKTYLEHYFIGEYVGIKSYKKVVIAPFDICASKKDMISNERFAKIKGLFAPLFSVAPDPVVLFPVDYGCIIVTAWGDESSDRLVINHQNN